jgi:thioredoxin 1
MNTKMESTTFKKISAEQFVERIITSKANSLVKFTSAWNGSARLLRNTLEDLALQYRGKVNFFLVDTEAEEGLASTYRIESTPTLLFFRKGTLVDRLSGLAQKATISNKIEQLVLSNQ